LIPKNILLIFNAFSNGGNSSKNFLDYTSFLQKHEIQYYLYSTLGANDKPEILRLFHLFQFTHISIIGGDGTINLTINALDDLDIPMHLIPSGSGNDFVKMIYNGKKQEEIFEMITKDQPTTMQVDVWKCNDLRFVNGFGAGFDGIIANKTARTLSHTPSQSKYWTEVMKQLFFYRSPTFNVNGVNYPTFMISAANGQIYGGGFKVAPNAVVDNGLLNIIRIKQIFSPLRLLFLPLVIYGKHLSRSFVDEQNLTELTINSDQKLAAHIDGEPLYESSYHIKNDGKMTILC
jgi:diacylglycerol kinase (ATP)